MRATDEIIAGRVTATGAQPAHRRYVVTLFGLYARNTIRQLPVAKIVTLLEQVGVDSASIRTSISRLKKKGVLEQAGKGAYLLSEELLPHFARRNTRIYDLRIADEDGSWLLVNFSVPESERQARHLLRSGLQRIGCGTVSAGLWIAPEGLREEIEDYLDEHDLRRFVDLFSADYLPTQDLPEKVGDWWDLDGIENNYAEFLRSYRKELTRWRRKLNRSAGEPSAELLQEAFVTHLPMFTHWRALPFADPGLPAFVLPKTWQGYAAHTLFTELHGLLFPLAARHVQNVLAGS